MTRQLGFYTEMGNSNLYYTDTVKCNYTDMGNCKLVLYKHRPRQQGVSLVACKAVGQLVN